MLDICKQQFLVLFLMMEAQLDPPQRFLRNADRPAFQQPIHRRIHMFAITQNFPQSRPRKGTPQALVRKFCKALVVAVEEPRKVGVEDPVARYKFAQHERLEEHAVWAMCHLAGEASGHDCTIMSSGVS